ncbi:Smg-4/UPF3 family-domain-containing protein [Xylariaceae sp. FL0804]|nr:Smg-4/UPF3 family-domain-containing protein [Xylariaceae sp. FL0804]
MASKANGMLPVSSAQTANDTPKGAKAKVPAQGKKVLIRRLPPGMTSHEFWAILGDEWREGKGKVGWTRFAAGHISHDPAELSMPARCYLHVLRDEYITTLNETVRLSTWEDAKHTSGDRALVGPPYLEQAAYQKIPTSKRRTDPKQGTIDQDPEFMAFLRSLTEETPAKEADGEHVTDEAAKTDAKIATTPLIEYLREKKANKVKEAANAKAGKHARHDSQGKAKDDSKKKGKDSKSEKVSEKEKEKDRTKEPVKLLTKKSTAQDVAEAAKSVANQIASNSSKAGEEAAPKSRRANIAAAAKILQKDLGLSPGSAHRRARQDAAKAEAATKTDGAKDKENKLPTPSASTAPAQPPSPAPPTTPTAPKAQIAESSRRSRGGKGGKQSTSNETSKGKEKETSGSGSTAKSVPTAPPVILKRKDEPAPTEPKSTTPASTTSTPAPPTGPKATSGKTQSAGKAPSQKKGQSQSLVTPGARRGFVKHANPSQGVTEALLKQSMETFGSVTFVEIDKRKGFAYVDFEEHDGLARAIAASPVTVAQGTVQVLERKETKKAPAAAAAAAATQPASDKAAATAEGPPDRPKRGGRGRGRKGGATARNASGANGTSEAANTSAPQGEDDAGTG